jgi:predicted ATPase
MGNSNLLQSLELKNFLSYGPEGVKLDLLPLNILIGPNGSGKSNFIQAIDLLHACPFNLEKSLRVSDETGHWTWKGKGLGKFIFEIIASVKNQQSNYSLCHHLLISPEGLFIIEEESIRLVTNGLSSQEPDNLYQYSLNRKIHTITEVKNSFPPGETAYREERNIDPREIRFGGSVLAQFKDIFHYPEITFLGGMYADTYFFRNSLIGHQSMLRGPQSVNLPTQFLSEDGSNLSLVINSLMNMPEEKKHLVHYLQKFYPYLKDLHTHVKNGTIDTCFLESGFSKATHSLRFSDGTLRFLCLLAVLCHPNPPPLICIEDPEIGLHPDVFSLLAQLLEEAAEKTQIIVTTQSDELVSAFSHRPEAVVVCERDDAGSHLRRLDREQLKEWLEKYSLGHLWRMGEIGGNP